MSTPFKSEWLQPGAVIPVDIPTLAAFAEELRRVNQENQALRQALETEQEPFEYWNAVEGWVKIDEVREHFDAVGCGTIYKSAGEGRSPLYTAPPKREWVGLTEKELYEATGIPKNATLPMPMLKGVEKALKEKNT